VGGGDDDDDDDPAGFRLSVSADPKYTGAAAPPSLASALAPPPDGDQLEQFLMDFVDRKKQWS
jgi:hypothetical protein